MYVCVSVYVCVFVFMSLYLYMCICISVTNQKGFYCRYMNRYSPVGSEMALCEDRNDHVGRFFAFPRALFFYFLKRVKENATSQLIACPNTLKYIKAPLS